ncbi:peptidoglycan glycosyltransferase [Litoreibacter halocynthiae]|uniref:Peptidoglycan glycosyltransferase n=1 Tax=Litoreibacter halocynthiae TaxID=1242689 RepID=A0A4R7LFB5_9RHOB|nr:penicillin-binding protein 2 [Litoreibacter halocynthiae]TDT73994.1 peptidoglycan glycosyltransferase [Litoreibacter halocynthiae]
MRRSAKDTEESAAILSRRGLVLGGGMALVTGVLGLRMRHLQVDQADQFRLLAEENRINIRLLPPARGQIFDRNGLLLAGNEQNYRVTMVRDEVDDPEKVLRDLAQLIPMTQEDMERAREELRKRSRLVPVTIADRLSWEDLSQVAVNAPALPGITPEVGLSRIYPRGADFAHIVGYVGPVSDYDLSRIEDKDPLLQIPKFQIGKTGSENKMEHELRGKAGTKRVEVNAIGRVMRELGRDESQKGANVQLTIDATLQNFVQARLAGESAAAVVIDVETGDLVSIGSAPAFDPNLFVRGISVKDYGGLTNNKYRPLANKAVQGTYPPGSTFKMVTALAALEAEEIRPDETIRCVGYTEVANRRFHCWKRGGHGRMNLRNSLKQSCDVYYYDLAQRVGIEKISAMARRLGLGERHDVPMSAVASGLMPTKAWKRENRDNDWVIGDSLNASIGQGFVLTSPLQLAVMTARLATNRAVSPRLVKSVDGVETPSGAGEPLGLSDEMMAHVQGGMFAVANENGGTAYGTRIADKSMRMAGKTGTSQVRNITKAERARGVFRNADLPWERRDHALYVGFAPADAPKYAIAVVVEHGGGGSTAAAPIARDIMLAAQTGGMPPLSAYPSAQRGRVSSALKKLQVWGLDEPKAPDSQA